MAVREKQCVGCGKWCYSNNPGYPVFGHPRVFACSWSCTVQFLNGK